MDRLREECDAKERKITEHL
jgi:hypothetical protein